MVTFESILGQSESLCGPNLYCPIVIWEIKAGFQVILFSGPRLPLGHPYYEPLVWFMIMP